MSAHGLSWRGVSAAGLVVLVLAGTASAATVLPPSVGQVSLTSPTTSGQTLTVTGKNLNRLRSIWLGSHRLQFTVVSPSEVTATVPRGSEYGTSLQFVFAKITISFKRPCRKCTSDNWQMSG